MPYNTIITKATKKGKVVELGIDVGLRNEMVCSIRDRIIDNLQATKRFLELGETYKEICAGIYTYAIEEYGKILFLNSLSPLPPPNNDKLKVPYTHYNHVFLTISINLNSHYMTRTYLIPARCSVEEISPSQVFLQRGLLQTLPQILRQENQSFMPILTGTIIIILY
jgi:hypothetical protein